ncbi:polyphosphoinositide phosphatase-like [Styela clava]
MTNQSSTGNHSCHFKINWIQLLQIYKTHTKYFVIGSNNAETKFKVLKIDRSEPKNLVIEEDKAEYTLPQVKEIIERLHAGNWGRRQSSWRQRGLVQTLTAFGIIGFVRFLEGYYMILVTKRSVAAELGGHRIFKVEDTSMIYIPNSNARISHPDESRYLKSFQMVDLSSNFYYSNSYDLSNSLQQNVTFQYACTNINSSDNEDNLLDADTSTASGSTPESWHYEESAEEDGASSNGKETKNNVQKLAMCIEATPCKRYIWNSFLKEPIPKSLSHIASDWTVDVIHGFLGQIKINVYGKPVYVTLIARRSSCFAGTRFLKRGCNIHGDIANEVETEQIVHSATVTSFLKGHYTAYIQHRGSVPVHWFQDITASVVPAKPPITIAMSNPYAQVTGKHFSQLYHRYGSPIIVLNLVRKHERRTHESQLGKAFKSAIDYLNLFLPVDQQIIYQTLDMANLSHSTKSDVLVKLAMIAETDLQRTGFFQSNMQLFQHTLNKNPKWAELKGVKFGPFRLQTGVVRSNCVDCLDRTNSAQFISSKCALAYQLFSLGLLQTPEIEFDTDATRLFEELFEEHGDIIALQYGGSQLVHTIQSYRQTAVLASHSRDIVTTLSRYYSNTFSDTYKQSAINLFLGIYRPEEHDCPQWDLSTDVYLHNVGDDILASFENNNYTMWLNSALRSVLPLPLDFVTSFQTANCLKNHMTEMKYFTASDSKVDWFNEFYRTGELTSFDDLFGLTIVDSMTGCLANGYNNISPFALRADKWQEIKNQNKVSDSLSSQSSLDQSSSSDDDSVLEVRYTADDIVNVATKSMLKYPVPSDPINPLDEFSPRESYGDKISWTPSRKDLNLYRRYIAVEDIHNKFIPNSVFSQDSIYHVEPPTVGRQSRQIYEKSVACCTQYPTTLLTNYRVYQDYVNSVGEMH